MAGSNSIVPVKVNDKISWFENHIDPWQTNSTAIGTTSAAVTNLQTLTVAARDAFNAQKAAQDAAVGATNALRMAVDAMGTAGADIIKSIRTKAATAGNSVYTLAAIPAPATPSPVPPPGTPFQLKVALKPNGALELTWKCNNPVGSQGTIYQIGRKIDDATAWEYLGGSGTKLFTDTTLPAGASKVTYQIQGVRSTAVGDAAEFVVNIGTTSGGEMTASISDGDGNGPAKIAA